MRLVVLADEILKEELLSNGTTNDVEIKWIRTADEFANNHEADGYIDLLFNNTRERVELLRGLSSQPVIVNSVVGTLEEINAPFIRINGWPGFLKRQIVEASSKGEPFRKESQRIFESLNKNIEWLPDRPGFIAPRVIAMIINEAWLALEEGVSTKEEIDTAMKLGTNYPYGPFEWGNHIGLKNVYALLDKLHSIKKRYQPAASMKKEIMT